LEIGNNQNHQLVALAEASERNYMKNKVKKGILGTLLEQESVIPPSQTDPVEPPKDASLDQKVDKYLISYEKDSVPTSDSYQIPGQPTTGQTLVQPKERPPIPTELTPKQEIYENKKNGLLVSLLFEAEGDAPDLGGGADAGGLGGDTGGGLDLGDAGGDAPQLGGDQPEAPVINTPKINLTNYAQGVARLINNYEALLNPKVTILNRAIEYVKVNYDEPTAKQFEELMGKYGIKQEEELRDQTQAPFAAGALAGSGGGGGG